MKKFINLQVTLLVLATVMVSGCTLATNGLRAPTQQSTAQAPTPATSTQSYKH